MTIHLNLTMHVDGGTTLAVSAAPTLTGKGRGYLLVGDGDQAIIIHADLTTLADLGRAIANAAEEAKIKGWPASTRLVSR